MDTKLIIITGFGPFVGHELVNASWEAVRLLPNSIEVNGTCYKIEKILIPVKYDAVDKHVDEIWKRNPELVVHCGVNGNAQCIYLEKLAYNDNFCRADYAGQIPDNPSICLDNAGLCCKSISTEIDVLSIVRTLCSNVSTGKPLFICSRDIGNYLCGYIYLKSLDRNRKRCIFIHVPPVDKPLSSVETSDAIYKITGECLKQLIEKR